MRADFVKRQNQFMTTLLLLILSLSGCQYLHSPCDEESKQSNSEQHVVIHFIDVGQGDAILIQLPTKNILIDGGTRNSNATEYIITQGIKHLDLVIATHPHEDHIGGLIRVIETLVVEEVIDPGYIHNSKTFDQYMALIENNEIAFTEGRSGMIRELGDSIHLQILHPAYLTPGHINDASIVARLSFKKISFLFAGDAENNSELQMLQRSYLIESQVLKIGHHGSNTSTSQEFLDAVNPEVAVISCGLNNRYGHPHEITIQKLNNAGIDIFRTDFQGTIIIKTDGHSISINKNPWRQILSYYSVIEHTILCAA
jgi:competence protein ComEC